MSPRVTLSVLAALLLSGCDGGELARTAVTDAERSEGAGAAVASEIIRQGRKTRIIQGSELAERRAAQRRAISEARLAGGTWELLPEARQAEFRSEGVGEALDLGDVVLLVGAGGVQTDTMVATGFDPVAGQWRRLPNPPLPWRYYYSAVAAGQQAIVWGGSGGGSGPEGARFDSLTQEWYVLPRAPFGLRAFHTAVWTGEEMIVWGGITRDRNCDANGHFRDGAAYDPAQDSWRLIPAAPLGGGARGVWTGEEMLLVRDGKVVAAYDPRADTWRRPSRSPLTPRCCEAVAWTGKKLLITGGWKRDPLRDGAAYNPRRDRWSLLPRSPLKEIGPAVWADDAMYVFVPGCCQGNRDAPDGARYEPR